MIQDYDNLLITRDWPLIDGNPKNHILQQRREGALKKLNHYGQSLDVMMHLIVHEEQANILDVACGTGFRVLELANQGYMVTGLEIDPNLCQLTNQAAVNFGLKARSICGDACRIPFDDESFDVVMSSSFFEHVYDVDLALQEQIRVLRPGGLLIIEDGNLLSPFELLNLLVLYPVRTKGQYGGFKWLFTKGQVKQNLYGYLPLGRDEDVHTMWWWKRKLQTVKDLQIIEVATMGKYIKRSLPFLPYPFYGPCLAVARKVGSASF